MFPVKKTRQLIFGHLSPRSESCQALLPNLISFFFKSDFLFCETWFPFLSNLISFFIKSDFLFVKSDFLSLHSIFSSVQCECWRATYIRCKTHTVPSKAWNRDWESTGVGLDFRLNPFCQEIFSWGQGCHKKRNAKSKIKMIFHSWPLVGFCKFVDIVRKIHCKSCKYGDRERVWIL